jgi:phosphatidylethanolamine/phosphatidyl-N-methylethanolamine N-methyltransferase
MTILLEPRFVSKAKSNAPTRSRKTMRDDSSLSLYDAEFAKEYAHANYGRNIVGYVMASGHRLVEGPYGSNIKFARVLEVGAGSGIHVEYIRHAFDEYWMTDASIEMLKVAEKDSTRNILVAVEDATKLSFESASFDRLIATHVLEHLYRPQEVLREWARVLRPGGIMSIVLPCDPGLLWRIGRNFGPRKRARMMGIPYDYIQAREHVNSITNLVTFLNYYFPDIDQYWWPTRIPVSDLNLIYAANIRV